MDVRNAPNKIFGRTKGSPYLGYFVHAPSAGNRASRYFEESVTEEEDWQRQKALRNRPNSGWFHPRPGSYSRLHSRYSKANTYFTRQPSLETGSEVSSVHTSSEEDVASSVSTTSTTSTTYTTSPCPRIFFFLHTKC